MSWYDGPHQRTALLPAPASHGYTTVILGITSLSSKHFDKRWEKTKKRQKQQKIKDPKRTVFSSQKPAIAKNGQALCSPVGVCSHPLPLASALLPFENPFFPAQTLSHQAAHFSQV